MVAKVLLVPALATLKSCKAYQLREQLNNGEKLSRADKNWLTEAITHKLRTPLAAITDDIELLEFDKGKPNEWRVDFCFIKQQNRKNYQFCFL